MSGLPLSFEMPDDVLDQIAERVAVLLIGSDQNAPEPWITVDQAAEHLGCRRQRIYDLTSQGRIKHGRDGSRLVFRRSDLDAYLEATA